MTKKCMPSTSPASIARTMLGCSNWPTRPHLSLESGDRVFVLHLVAGQHLDGDDLVELAMAGFVDGAHSAFA